MNANPFDSKIHISTIKPILVGQKFCVNIKNKKKNDETVQVGDEIENHPMIFTIG